ncbi:MAG: hypothetical protein OQK03_10490, partial [Colwellia sp.]|nr:hypothetical protein [Colwellia sp.]
MNIQCLSFKLQAIRVVKQNLIGFFILFATVFSVQAQENTQAFISDDLSIFMHAGPGTNYRILG